jgi:hypothetical protein
MAYEHNDYDAFIRGLDLDQLSDLSDAMNCVGKEGTSLEGIVQPALIQNRVYIIPRGRDRVLLYDQHSKTRVWVNRTTPSEKAFNNVLNDEILRRITPFSDLASYYAHAAALASDD